MRIRVTTSINVRSNTVPPTPTQVDDAFPDPEEVRKIVEKPRSKSPIPFLPPLPDMATARFKATQRPPPGSRFSAWLHGNSTLSSDRNHAGAHARQTSHTRTYCYYQTPRRRSPDRTTGLRPTNSTRGVIDAVHSPTMGAWPVPPQGRDQHVPLSPLDNYQTRMLKEMGYSQNGHRKIKSPQIQKKQRKACFPQIKDPKVRGKAIGSLIFGIILAIVVTIYLALATSNTAWGATFHAIFIFFILVLTIIFTHYLIRLCMLAMRPKNRYKLGGIRQQRPSPSDEEAAFAQINHPIPVVVAVDEVTRPGNAAAAAANALDEEGSEKDLPAPPPIYGNWRDSVRADPNLIHWQLHTNQPAVQREARELIFAGSGHRPPSYEEDERVARPLPLFAERRRAASVVDL